MLKEDESNLESILCEACLNTCTISHVQKSLHVRIQKLKQEKQWKSLV